ncbi:MAG TPA: hypothetical protein VMY36_00070 [Patescibacteria group bacterium]|nr:hypothetical protein [Patescibacteria group bacterium]
MKPDIIVTWPSGLDYPLWRWFIKQYRKLFNEVIVVFYPHGSLDFSLFLKENFLETTFLISDTHTEHWREDAVNTALNQAKSDWIWFTEQDFIVKDQYFFDRVFEAMKKFDVIGTRQGIRLHPCCIFAKKELVLKTNRDFGTGEKDWDHFSKVTKQLEETAKIGFLEDLGLKEGRDWYHMTSLTWNYFRAMDNEIKDFHEPANFLVWNFYNRMAKVPQDPKFMALSYRVEQLLSSFGKFLE